MTRETPDLRAALERELAYVAGDDVLVGRLTEARDRILLTATPEPAPAVLDVERLAKAIQTAIYDGPDDKGHVLGPLDNARAIATEYAVLATPDDGEAGTDG